MEQDNELLYGEYTYTQPEYVDILERLEGIETYKKHLIKTCGEYVITKRCCNCGELRQYLAFCKDTLYCPECAKRETAKQAFSRIEDLLKISEKVGGLHLGNWVITLPEQVVKNLGGFSLEVRNRLERVVKATFTELYGDVGYWTNIHFVGDDVDRLHSHLDILLPEIRRIGNVERKDGIGFHPDGSLDIETVSTEEYEKFSAWHMYSSPHTKVRKTLLKHMLKEFKEEFKGCRKYITHYYQRINVSEANLAKLMHQFKYSWRRPAQMINDAFAYSYNRKNAVNVDIALKILDLPRNYRFPKGFGIFSDSKIRRVIEGHGIKFVGKAIRDKLFKRERCKCRYCGYNDWEFAAPTEPIGTMRLLTCKNPYDEYNQEELFVTVIDLT